MWKTVSLLCYLMVLSIYDIKTRKIPVFWLLIGGVAALANLIYLGCDRPPLEFWSELLKSWVPGVLMLLAGWLSGKVGYGDGCVLLVAGSILGGVKITAVFLGGLFIAAMTAIVLLVFRKVKKNDKLPFIPFLAVSALVLEGMRLGRGVL